MRYENRAKKWVSLLLLAGIAVSSLAGCGNSGGGQSAASGEPASAASPADSAPAAEGEQAAGGAGAGVTLTSFCMGNIPAGSLKTIAANYEKENPGFALDITAVDGVTDFNTALAAKIAANQVPDILYTQWDTNLTKYAKNGYILPLDDLGLDDKVVNIKKKINMVDGKTYAYPTVQSLWGMLWNTKLAKEHGVDTIPKTMDQLLESFETLRQNGLEFPYLTAGKDLSGATWWIMAYMHQQIAGQDPTFYLKICEGEKSWNCPEIQEMYDYYGKMLEYAPKDYLGVDTEEFKRRFARGEFVMSIHGNGIIKDFRTLNPDMEFVLAPSMAVKDEKDYGVISDFNDALAIGATTKNEAAAKDFYKYCFTPESSTIIATDANGVSPVIGATPEYDPAVVENLPYIEAGNFVGFSERDWIPGIRDVLKKNTQDWMSGSLTLDQALDGLQAEHQRLLDATPTYVEEYKELLRGLGMID